MNDNLKNEGKVEKVLSVTDPFARPRQTSSRKYGNSLKEYGALKVKEEASKIGRRYSFDDNGGGYQGL
jgi:hypothetical protein